MLEAGAGQEPHREPVSEQGGESCGRCIYCDERCGADARWHDYCHREHEREMRQLTRLRKPEKEQIRED